MRLAGKAGIVTGTSKGLGRETLRLLAGEGAAILVDGALTAKTY